MFPTQPFHCLSAPSRALLRSGFGILLFLTVFAVSGQNAQAQSGLTTHTLPSISYLELRRSDGLVMHLQRGTFNRQNTVRVWVNGRYAGEGYIPQRLFDVTATHELRLVLETWMGRVRQVQKQVPVVRVPRHWQVRVVGG